ncbi:hypothetical protein ACLB2K_064070 [Fragaria x ananassa]
MQDAKAAVSDGCCKQVKRIGANPSCLCAVLLSDTAKCSGVKPEVAITIHKRCNFANRPVGYKCGADSHTTQTKRLTLRSPVACCAAPRLLLLSCSSSPPARLPPSAELLHAYTCCVAPRVCLLGCSSSPPARMSARLLLASCSVSSGPGVYNCITYTLSLVC